MKNGFFSVVKSWTGTRTSTGTRTGTGMGPRLIHGQIQIGKARLMVLRFKVHSKYYSVILINYNFQPGVLTFFILFAFILLIPGKLIPGQHRVTKASIYINQ